MNHYPTGGNFQQKWLERDSPAFNAIKKCSVGQKAAFGYSIFGRIQT